MADSNKFVQHVSENYFIPNSVLVDCTADSHIASHYYYWLQRGILVVTPNKKANSGPLDQYLKVIILARESSLDLELSDIPVQSLVPEPLRATVFADDFLHDLPKFDEELSKQRQVAEDEGEVLRYVGVVDVVNGKGLLN